MARPIGADGAKTHEAIRDAAIKLIYRHGYAGMTLRQLAAEVGIQPGSLYNHIQTKQDLLFELIRSNMERMLAQLEVAVDGLASPTERLAAFVAFHLRYHTARRREASICTSELRSLDQINYRTIAGLKRRYESILVDILNEGMRSRSFRAHDASVTSSGILSMLSGTCTWYRPEGRLTLDDLVSEYTDFVLRSLKAA